MSQAYSGPDQQIFYIPIPIPNAHSGIYNAAAFIPLSLIPINVTAVENRRYSMIQHPIRRNNSFIFLFVNIFISVVMPFFLYYQSIHLTGSIPFIPHAADRHDFSWFRRVILYLHAKPADIYGECFIIDILLVAIPQSPQNLFC